MGKAGQLLMMLAPLVMAALGRHASQNGLDAGGISDVLQSSHAQAQAQAPAGLGGILGSLLDQDHDGKVMDDVGGLLGGLLKGG